MSAVVIAGDTSGSITLDAPAVAGTTTLTLPATSGTVLTTTSPKAGNVIQVVQATKTDTFTTTSTSFTTITGLSASITPVSSSNKILVIISVNGSQQVNVNDVYLGIFRNGTQIALGDASGSRIRSTGQLMTSNAGWSTTVTFNFVDSPATTSSITYTVQTRTNGTGTSYINRGATDSDGSIGSGRTPSSIILMEIAG
jgi:hypothetical protein